MRGRRTTRRPMCSWMRSRRSVGIVVLLGMSLMWGFWEPRGTGMTAHLGKAELMRMRRQGVLPLSLDLGLELLDAALSRPEAVLDPSPSGRGVCNGSSAARRCRRCTACCCEAG